MFLVPGSINRGKKEQTDPLNTVLASQQNRVHGTERRWEIGDEVSEKEIHYRKKRGSKSGLQQGEMGEKQLRNKRSDEYKMNEYP